MTNFSKLKVSELKAELSSRALSTTGTKAKLVARLQQSIEDEKLIEDSGGNVNDVAVSDATTDAAVAANETSEVTPEPVVTEIVETDSAGDIAAAAETTAAPATTTTTTVAPATTTGGEAPASSNTGNANESNNDGSSNYLFT